MSYEGVVVQLEYFGLIGDFILTQRTFCVRTTNLWVVGVRWIDCELQIGFSQRLLSLSFYLWFGRFLSSQRRCTLLDLGFVW